jgi:membrane-bound lytic murein transglycosylase A
VSVATALLLAACAQQPLPALERSPTEVMRPDPDTRRAFDRIPGWHADDLNGLSDAIERQCRLARPPGQWRQLCREFRDQRGKLRAWIEARFEPRLLRNEDGSEHGLLTGYYEPLLTGSLARRSSGQVALHRQPPAQLLAGRPSRARIENENLLAGHELVWIDDPVEAFFLHVQGSGRVQLDDGRWMRVGYAGHNGQRYRAIGSVLIQRGALRAGQVDAQAIRDWLHANPSLAREVMQSNPRYVFFREIQGVSTGEGPLGSLGVPLTAGRSLAVDRKRVADGSLMFIDTTNPMNGRPLRKAVMAQDTGAAIVGQVRADLFWGSGAQAGEAAGRMKQRSRIWVLEPRN